MQNVLLFTLTIAVTACSSQQATAGQGSQRGGGQASITFRQGKMIEAAFLKVRPGKEDALGKEYFPEAIKVASEYGLQPLGTFGVTRVEHGPAEEVGMWGFFEWPSVAKKAAFEKDPRFVPLRKFRDSLLVTPPKQVYLQVKKTVTVPLKASHMYEAAVVWVNPSRKENLDKYFGAAGPFIAKRNVQFPAEFTVIGEPEDEAYTFDTLPNTFFFIDWPSRAVKEEWFASDDFARVGHHRALALDRLFIVESKFSPPQS